MVVSSRGILAIGLGLTGLVLVVGPSVGQGQAQDGAVHKAANPAAGTSPPAPTAPMIGTVDVEQVFKSYEKVKVSQKEYSAALLARKNDLMKIMQQAQEEAQTVSKMAPGTADYKKHENNVTALKAKYEAEREQAQREFELRSAESMATLYKEIQAMVARVARWRKLNYVVKVSSQPISGTEPNSVMNAISSTVVYADPHNDITQDVIFNLNRYYKVATTGSTTPAQSATTGAGAPGAQQATRPAQPDGN